MTAGWLEKIRRESGSYEAMMLHRVLASLDIVVDPRAIQGPTWESEGFLFRLQQIMTTGTVYAATYVEVEWDNPFKGRRESRPIRNRSDMAAVVLERDQQVREAQGAQP